MISCLFVHRVNNRTNAFIKYVSCIVRSFVLCIIRSLLSCIVRSFVLCIIRSLLSCIVRSYFVSCVPLIKLTNATNDT